MCSHSHVDIGINWGVGHPTNLGVCVQDTFADYFISPEGAVPWKFSCVGGVA